MSFKRDRCRSYDQGPMTQPPPLWHRAVTRLDEVVAPRAEAFVRSETFAVASGLALRAKRDLARGIEHGSRQAWHLLNLPAGSDVNRLLAQIASLERQIRVLEKRLTDSGPRPSHHDAARSRPPARTRPA